MPQPRLTAACPSPAASAPCARRALRRPTGLLAGLIAGAVLPLLAAAPAVAAPARDQGAIFGTAGTLGGLDDDLMQEIVAGLSGQLTAIEVQLPSGIPSGAMFDFELIAGAVGGGGASLFAQSVDPMAVGLQASATIPSATSGNILSWDLSGESLFFEAGDAFVFRFSATTDAVTLAANNAGAEPGGYAPGRLFRNGALQAGEDLAFISFVDVEASPPGAEVPAPGAAVLALSAFGALALRARRRPRRGAPESARTRGGARGDEKGVAGPAAPR